MSENYSDKPKTISKLRRYANVTTTVSGLAARLAGERYLGLKIDKKNHARVLREALGGLKGPLMKVAQILSTIPDALPKEYREELSQLQADAPPMGWLFVKRRMANELGQNWQKHFKEFEKNSTFAASLGQVHKAKSFKNETLACKLQYPDMQSIIEADLKQLKLAFSIYQNYDSAISTNSIHTELKARLYEELDYQREMANLNLYQIMLKDEKSINVPKVFKNLSSKRLLSMSWLNGKKLTEWLKTKPSQDEKNKIALNMFRAWYVPFYYFGVIHGDPHLGNYSITDKNKINLLDFGSIRFFSPSFVEGVIQLYESLKENDKELAVEAYKKWGFGNLNKDIIKILNLWAEFIYAPLLNDSSKPISQLRDGSEGRKIASRVHQELKQIGGIEPPREFVLMDRAAVGLGSVFMHLKSEINWHRTFEEIIEKFNVKKLDLKQKSVAKSVGIDIKSIK